MDIVLVCHTYVKVLLAKAVGLKPMAGKLAMLDVGPGTISRIDFVLGYAVVKFIGEDPKKLITTVPSQEAPSTAQKVEKSPEETTTHRNEQKMRLSTIIERGCSDEVDNSETRPLLS